MPRFYCPLVLPVGAELELPAAAARHVQVLRLQPGARLTLFNGEGGEASAQVLQMGRSQVRVQVLAHEAIERENLRSVQLALVMPANERMDWLVEKATELGVTAIQPLQGAHSVLRLKGERADKKVAHWQAIASAACEQCGRNRLPTIAPVREALDWLSAAPAAPLRALLSLAPDARPLASLLAGQAEARPVSFFSGPEGGLAPSEETAARAVGFVPVSLGPRILRAETAALLALAQCQ